MAEVFHKGHGVHPERRIDSDRHGDFVRELGIPTVLMGFGLPDDNLHAPNEKFNLSNFHRGIESVVRFFDILGEQGR